MYTALLLFFFASLIISFLCSLWEAVLLSISPAYIKIQQNEGNRTGTILKHFKDNIDKPLAGILTLNTIAHTVGAFGVGHEAAKIWADTYPLITAFFVPALMTVAILILSEIIPKTIGATNWRVLAPFTVQSLHIVIKVLTPAIWLCQFVTAAFSKNKNNSVFSRNDFLAMAQIGAKEGKLNKLEMDFLQNILQFKDVKAREIMTPRPVVAAVSQDMTFKEFYDQQDEFTFSRIPLLESDKSDSIIGYILKDDVLEGLVDGTADKKLADIRRNIIIVSESSNIIVIFRKFINQREHIALVIDEYGSTLGLVTLEDVVETLLGAEIVDETDKIVDLQSHAKQNWRRRMNDDA